MYILVSYSWRLGKSRIEYMPATVPATADD
jgi:hypothetical protein